MRTNNERVEFERILLLLYIMSDIVDRWNDVAQCPVIWCATGSRVIWTRTTGTGNIGSGHRDRVELNVKNKIKYSVWHMYYHLYDNVYHNKEREIQSINVYLYHYSKPSIKYILALCHFVTVGYEPNNMTYYNQTYIT